MMDMLLLVLQLYPYQYRHRYRCTSRLSIHVTVTLLPYYSMTSDRIGNSAEGCGCKNKIGVPTTTLPVVPRDAAAVSSCSNAVPAGGMIVWSRHLAQRLSTSECRLPTTFVGVRRLRPSSRFVAKAAQTNGKKRATAATSQEEPLVTPAVYKVVDSQGQERRMTSREKREAKWQEKLEAKRIKLEAATRRQQQNATSQTGSLLPMTMTEPSVPQQQPQTLPQPPREDHNKHYVQLAVDSVALEQELADLRGDRDGVPPVLLPPPLCRLALPMVGQPQTASIAVADDAMAQTWAVALKESMRAAEKMRQGEDLRPMPYHLVPEVWSRLRPPETTVSADSEGSSDIGPEKSLPSTVDEESEKEVYASNAWAFCQIRPSQTDYDDDVAAVIQLLHCRTKLHIACGAKFGCDYLLYDGPRHERHAFAGLRILRHSIVSHEKHDSSLVQFPLPTAYDMAGYVRCLNTAGKLALLATVVREKGNGRRRRVLMVDLALEKIVATTSRRPRKTMEQRVQNLAKT